MDKLKEIAQILITVECKVSEAPKILTCINKLEELAEELNKGE